MFRYWCSKWSDKLSWKEAEAESFEKLIKNYHRDHLRTYDADNDGDDTAVFAIKSPEGETRYFMLKYEWNIDYRNDADGAYQHIENPCWITEINREEAGNVPGDRDWLILPKTYRPCTCGR